MLQKRQEDDFSARAASHFRALVESVGNKNFATAIGLSSRQVNRILAGAQPNPVERMILALQAATPEVGDRVLDFVCQEMGGYLIRSEASLDGHAVNAVRESAEAIAAISDGSVTEIDEEEIREAICALIALSRVISERRQALGPGPIPLHDPE